MYFAIGPLDSPAMIDATDRTLALGYKLHGKDPTCDNCAVSATLPADPKADNLLLSVYFATQADALKVAAAYKPCDAWVGKVKTMCPDLSLP